MVRVARDEEAVVVVSDLEERVEALDGGLVDVFLRLDDGEA